MKKSIGVSILLTMLLLVVGFNLPAFAEPQSIPNGPWIESEQTVMLERLMSNEELAKRLFQIQARSKGRMEIELAGTSTYGIPIYIAKFGEPHPDKIGVLIEAQIHGGEPLGAEVCLAIIKHLATSSNNDIFWCY